MPGVPRWENPLETDFWAKVAKGVGQTLAQHGAQKKSQQPAGKVEVGWPGVSCSVGSACYWMGGESVVFVEMISSLFLVGWWASQLVVTCHGRALQPFFARLQYLWTIPSSAHLSSLKKLPIFGGDSVTWKFLPCFSLIPLSHQSGMRLFEIVLSWSSSKSPNIRCFLLMRSKGCCLWLSHVFVGHSWTIHEAFSQEINIHV